MLVDVRLDADLARVPAVVRELEAAGVSGAFTYEGPGDPFLPLGAAAVASTTLALYTNLAIALPRSPMHLAYLAQDLSRACGGRFSLGLGTQVKAHITRRFGATWESPVAQPQEVVDAIAVIGSPAEVAEALSRRFGRCTRVALSTPYPLSVGVLAELTALAR